jgi:DNA (cytosine-5)-methyltransferase 1
MRYATICSGIGAPEQAWRGLWGKPAFTSEIEKFPSAVLKHHYPDIPNYGDMTKYKEWPNHELGLVCGGTPCQSFSVAGLRKGMDDPRGNLTLTFLGILARHNPRWFIWENVPGVLSSNEGRDFASFIRGLQELGYSCAYRVLDAQYFGVPQRRRRVFVVGYLGDDWRPPFAVLFEPESLRGNIAPSRKEGEAVTALTSNGVGTCGADDNQAQGGHLIHCNNKSRALTAAETATGRLDPNEQEFIVTAFNSDQSEKTRSMGESVEQCPTLRSGGVVSVAAFGCKQAGGNYTQGLAPTLDSGGGGGMGAGMALHKASTVRRLTPMECERLQGFPDSFTRIPWRGKPASECPDGPRYKALGNSMAVPVVRWLGHKMQMWEELPTLPPQKCRP